MIQECIFLFLGKDLSIILLVMFFVPILMYFLAWILNKDWK